MRICCFFCIFYVNKKGASLFKAVVWAKETIWRHYTGLWKIEISIFCTFLTLRWINDWSINCKKYSADWSIMKIIVSCSCSIEYVPLVLFEHGQSVKRRRVRVTKRPLLCWYHKMSHAVSERWLKLKLLLTVPVQVAFWNTVMTWCVWSANTLWPSAWLSLCSVSHRVSHDPAGFSGSAFLEWQPAGVCSPVSVWPAQPHRALPLQVSPSVCLPTVTLSRLSVTLIILMYLSSYTSCICSSFACVKTFANLISPVNKLRVSTEDCVCQMSRTAHTVDLAPFL